MKMKGKPCGRHSSEKGDTRLACLPVQEIFIVKYVSQMRDNSGRAARDPPESSQQNWIPLAFSRYQPLLA